MIKYPTITTHPIYNCAIIHYYFAKGKNVNVLCSTLTLYRQINSFNFNHKEFWYASTNDSILHMMEIS